VLQRTIRKILKKIQPHGMAFLPFIGEEDHYFIKFIGREAGE
jgi:hypothetical protein